MASMPIKAEQDASKNLHQVCRLCLSEEYVIGVFEEEGLHQWIADFLSITISTDDRMSQVVCAICRIRLIEFHQFHLSVQEVQDVLRSQIQDENGPPAPKKHKKSGCTRCGKSVSKRTAKVINVDKYKTKSSTNHHTLEELPKVKTEYCEGIDSTIETQEPNSTAPKEPTHENPEDDTYDLHETPQHMESDASEGTCDSMEDYEKHQHKKMEDDQTIGMEDMIEIVEMKMEHRADNEGESLGYKTSYIISEVDPHQAKNKNSVKPNQCDVCDKSFKNSLLLWKHKSSVHGPKIFKCDVCGLAYGSRNILSVHMRSKKHLQKLNKKNNVEIITANPKNTVENIKHNMVQIKAEKDVTEELSTNIVYGTYIGTYDNDHSCSKCKLSFTRQSQLKKHMRTHDAKLNTEHLSDTEEREHQSGDDDSNNCPQTPTPDQSTQADGKSKDEEKPWRCDKCPKRYSQKKSLIEHGRYHRTRKYVCPICGRPFLKQYGLRNHIPTHDAIRQWPKQGKNDKNVDRPHKCDVPDCNSAFSSQSGLWGHKKHVHGPKILECHICDFKFSMRKDLRRHIRRHYGPHQLGGGLQTD